MTPLHVHDCTACTYLGSDRLTDFYFCLARAGPTVIARYGDGGGDYQSGAGIGLEDLRLGRYGEPLAVAVCLACKRGLMRPPP